MELAVLLLCPLFFLRFPILCLLSLTFSFSFFSCPWSKSRSWPELVVAKKGPALRPPPFGPPPPGPKPSPATQLMADLGQTELGHNRNSHKKSEFGKLWVATELGQNECFDEKRHP